MAAIKFVFGVLLAVATCFVLSSCSIQEAEEVQRGLCPWCPQWVPCNFTEIQGATCQDCTSKLVCTPKGGKLIKCFWPGKQHCVNGDCVADPSEECKPEEPAPEEPAPVEPAHEDPAPEKLAPEEPAPEEPAPVEPAPEAAPENL